MRYAALMAGLTVLLVALSALALAIGPSPDAQAQPAAAIALDMDPTATPANNANVLGTREDCARIEVNGSQDFDEDLIDAVIIDVTIQGVAPYSNNGTPGDTTDDTGGITGYQYPLQYDSSQLTVEAVEFGTGAVNMVANNAGSSVSQAGDSLPDDNTDNSWFSAVLDTGISTPEDGDGVLDRLTISAEATAVAGQYPLNLVGPVHLDATNAAHSPTLNLQGDIAINQACAAITTPTPTESPTPSPSPSASPTASPSPTPTRTPSPVTVVQTTAATPTRTPARSPTPRGGVGGFTTGGSPEGGDGMSPFVIGGAAIMFAAVSLGGYTLTRRLRREL